MLLVTWPYNFDLSCEISPFSFKDLRGLSPRALCRNVNEFFDISVKRTIRHYLNKTKFHSFWRNQNVADGTVRLKSLSVSNADFDSMNF